MEINYVHLNPLRMAKIGLPVDAKPADVREAAEAIAEANDKSMNEFWYDDADVNIPRNLLGDDSSPKEAERFMSRLRHNRSCFGGTALDVRIGAAIAEDAEPAPTAEEAVKIDWESDAGRYSLLFGFKNSHTTEEFTCNLPGRHRNPRSLKKVKQLFADAGLEVKNVSGDMGTLTCQAPGITLDEWQKHSVHTLTIPFGNDPYEYCSAYIADLKAKGETIIGFTFNELIMGLSRPGTDLFGNLRHAAIATIIPDDTDDRSGLVPGAKPGDAWSMINEKREMKTGQGRVTMDNGQLYFKTTAWGDAQEPLNLRIVPDSDEVAAQLAAQVGKDVELVGAVTGPTVQVAQLAA